MIKNKLFLVIILFVILIASSVLFFIFRNKAPAIDALDSTLADIKQVIGMDLNLAPERAKWNTGEEELNLNGKGYLYLDALNAPKITEIYDNLCRFFESSGFKNNSYNNDINDKTSILKKFIKDEIVCNLIKKNNPNDTSTVSVACANIKNITFSFSSGEGNNCQADSDCRVITDGCLKARVCRNLKYEFYNDCANPSQKVQDVNFDVAKCQCVSNVCVPKKNPPSPTNSPASSPLK